MTTPKEIIFPSEDQIHKEIIYPAAEQLNDFTEKPRDGMILSIIKSQIKEHPLTTLWSLTLFIGGLIFIAYYFDIQYMPELDLSASASLLAAVSLTGIFVIFIFAVYAVSSGAVWAEATKENTALRATLFKGDHVNIKTVLLLILIPNILVLTIVNLIFWSDTYKRFITVAMVVGIILGGLLFFNSLMYLKNSRQPMRKTISIYISVTIISWLFLMMQPIFIYVIADLKQVPVFPDLLGVQLAVVFLNIWALKVPKSFKSRFLWYLTTGFLIVFFTLLGLRAMLLVPRGVVREFGFGNLDNASVIVNQEGRELLTRRGVPIVCAEGESMTCLEGIEGGNLFTVKNVDILSRLGNSYYVRCKYKDRKPIKFTLPSSMILSWDRPAR